MNIVKLDLQDSGCIVEVAVGDYIEAIRLQNYMKASKLVFDRADDLQEQLNGLIAAGRKLSADVGGIVAEMQP